MPKSFKQPLSFTAANGTQHTFTTSSELRVFVEDEQEFWKFHEERLASANNSLANLSRWPIERLAAFHAVLVDHENGRVNDDQVKDQLDATYSHKRQKIPTSDSPDGQALKLMSKELAGDAYFAAANFLLKRYDDSQGAPRPNQDAHWLGLVAAVSYRLGQSPMRVAATANALEELRSQHSALLNVEQDKLSRQRAEWNTALSTFEANGTAMIDDARTDNREQSEQASKRYETLVSELTQHSAEAKAQWEQTHRTFIEQLHLEAPRKYWSDKRVDHRKRAKMWGWIAAIYALVATGFMVWGIDSEYSRLVKMTAATPIGAYVALAARGLVISVVVFWVGRILVRMFLSELHLTMDSYERSTMVSTYLALTQEGKIDEKERALVLAPLFRPTADGWVKDDASADANMTNLASMLGKK